MTDHLPTPLHVVELIAPDTHALRRAVLRNGDPAAVVEFAEDSWPGVFHLGARAGDSVVGVATWIPRPPPSELIEGRASEAAVQLRGMATADGWRGSGVGALVIEAGCARCHLDGVTLVWARARDAALDFYRRNGFDVVGDGFVDASTGLPHHLVRRALR